MTYKFIMDDIIDEMLDDVIELKLKTYFKEFGCDD